MNMRTLFIICTILVFNKLNGQYGSIQSFVKTSATTSIMNNFLDDSDFFGISIDSIGDLNNDGVTDLVVGSMKDDDGGLNSGAVYLLMMRTNKTIKTVKKISKLTPTFFKFWHCRG
jgi:hypothetical protein